MPVVFLRDIYEKVLSIESTDKEQSNIFQELSNISIGEKPAEKLFFIKRKNFT